MRFIQQQLLRSDLSNYTLQKSATLNAEGGTYAPFYMNDGSLWFTSTRPQGDEKGKINNNRIYAASTDGSVKLTFIPQLKDEQQGVATATPDGKRLYLTRWMAIEDKKTATIYTTANNNGKWDEPTIVSALNVAGSNAQQPFVMPDGKTILFSSDRAGAVGGFDIWKASLDELGNVGIPVNLGPMVNTASDEQAASFHAASNTLVFSSNGRVGMGGFDFYYIKGGLEQLSEPKNFGYPVNSVKDDLYFASKGSANNILENVVMSSDRDAACCLELFTLSKVKPLKQITGLVLACDSKQPLPGVKVSITDETGKLIAEKTTDGTGSYSYSMEEFSALKATGAVSGYFNSSVNVSLPSDEEMVNFNNPDLCLTPVPVAAIKVDNVYYNYNKATLQPNSLESLDQLVNLLNENPTMFIELGAHTDSKGDDAYNQKLSDARAKTVVDYLIGKGIDASRLVAKGYGESHPIAENNNADGTDNPEGRQQNRRTEFKVLKN
ncbi:MAG: OmpA family protein [Ferruginibacter sp.]